MQYKFHLQENLSFKNLRGYLIINELKKPLKERFFQGQRKVSVIYAISHYIVAQKIDILSQRFCRVP